MTRFVRVRPSTLALCAAFIAVFILYLAVRPAPVTDPAYAPAARTSPAVPAAPERKGTKTDERTRPPEAPAPTTDTERSTRQRQPATTSTSSPASRSTSSTATTTSTP